MNETIIKDIKQSLNISEASVKAVLSLLEEGNTIPFIARYRKEATNNLDEEQIRSISDVYNYEVNLLKRKEDVLRLIAEKELLTKELEIEIMNAKKLVEVEDIYRPFKEKKKTKATEAIALGLEPYAKALMMFNPLFDYVKEANKYLIKDVTTIDQVLELSSYIIAEYISDNAKYRKWIRNYTFNNGVLETTVKKNHSDDKKIYEMYYNYSEKIKHIKEHRVLAINRAEKEKVITAKIVIDDDKITDYLETKIMVRKVSYNELITKAILDSYKRLIKPSIERELRSELTEKASDAAIDLFAKNLESLLLQPPMKEKVVLALDPAFRTGCKLAVLNKQGKEVDISVIYPHEPKNQVTASKNHILALIDKYEVDIIAIGNGTASRESETFIAETIKEASRTVSYIIVNEAGASVYSASKLAISEYPNLHVEERSAISIGRRLQDPLAELVKIDPKSIGVGQYQHDVNNKKLNDSLDFTVSKTVNQVGVNINTASPSLLNYISGLTKSVITKIIDYRDNHGKIKNRGEIKAIKGISDKVFEQAVGFIRVIDGDNKLDETSIHPESYGKAMLVLNEISCTVNDVGSDKIKQKLNGYNRSDLAAKINIDKFTLEDIINSLIEPLRDPRDDIKSPLLKSDILKIEDLKIGMQLEGTVRNVVDFGAFIDIGLKNDGLVHISKLTKSFIKHPMEVVSVGDIVTCYVIKIDLDKHKVSLSLLENEKVA